MTALIWFAASPVRARLLLLSLSGDDYPRGPSRISATVSFCRSLCWELESMKFAANCRLQVEGGCGADEPTSGCRRS